MARDPDFMFAAGTEQGGFNRYEEHNDEGFLKAYNHAKQFGYDVWETYKGQAYALMYRARAKD